MNNTPSASSQLIDVGCDLSYQVNTPTSLLLQIAAAQNEYQSLLSETMHINPFTPVEEVVSGSHGNRTHRLLVQPGPLTIRYQARVSSNLITTHHQQLEEVLHSQLPTEVLPFLNPSRYCESDRLVKYAYDEFGRCVPGYTRVQQISQWVHSHLDYTPGSTGPNTTACDVLLQREGVCRDYAHVAISFCRAMGIPARYVAGYAIGLQPPDFHGFFEAYLSHRWYLFDATQLAPVSGFVRIGVGLDAAEVSFASFVGEMYSTEVRVWTASSTPELTATLQEASHSVATSSVNNG